MSFRRLVMAGLALIVTALSPGRGGAATSIPAGDLPEQLWTAAGSPYTVEGDVQMPALTVEAGTIVLVVASPSPPGITITITGPLTVRGTLQRPAEFRAQSGTTAELWNGILVLGSGDVTGAVVRHTRTALNLGTQGAHVVRQSLFEATRAGINIAGGTIALDGVRAIDVKGFGVMTTGSLTELTASNCLFVRNGLDGIACNSGRSGRCTITSSTFDGNFIGIYRGYGTQVDVSNSIFTNNRTAIDVVTGGFDISSPLVRVSRSDLWSNTIDNSPSNLAGLFETTGSIAVDPQYVAPGDYRLRPSSPCIDSGSATLAPDHDIDLLPRPLDGDGLPDTDGSAFDMGAHEFDRSAMPTGSGGAGGGTGGNGGAGAGGGNGGNGGAGAGESGGSDGTRPDGGDGGALPAGPDGGQTEPRSGDGCDCGIAGYGPGERIAVILFALAVALAVLGRSRRRRFAISSRAGAARVAAGRR